MDTPLFKHMAADTSNLSSLLHLPETALSLWVQRTSHNEDVGAVDLVRGGSLQPLPDDVPLVGGL
jgi:hypothetical protein